jgi:N-acetylglucosamine-6-phosphate deacetylase
MQGCRPDIAHTDALFAAGSDLPDGSVLRQANGMETVLEDGVMKLPDRQEFAGSVATMDRLVRNMVHLAGVPLWDAVAMATATPARVIGLADRKGSLAPGFDADIVLMDKQLNVKAVMARGQFVE